MQLLEKIILDQNYFYNNSSLFHKTFHDANLKIVKQILLNNDYPNSFIGKNIKIRTNKIKYSSPNSLNKKNRSDL